MSILTDSVKQQIIKVFTNKFLGKAGRVLANKTKVLGFLTFAQSRFAEVGKQQGLDSFKDVVRMVRLSVTGKYPQLPWKSALSIVGVFLYFVSPIDVIPDFVPFLGFLDDIFLLTKLFDWVSEDLSNFRDWEAKSGLVQIEYISSEPVLDPHSHI
jgi:uncharacterized membrane protein YkvA (DUF1232 family)